jgi:CheY-like chemotaxis protein
MLKILLIEDHLDLAGMMQRQLKHIGLSSVVATNGPEALKKAPEEMPALILMDIVLQGEMNGFEVANKLKADAQTRSIPILAITGRTLPRDQEMCFESGCDGYLAKPFGFHELQAQIAKLLNRSDSESGPLKVNSHQPFGVDLPPTAVVA